MKIIPSRLEALDGASWETFLAAPWSVLMLGKSDCEHCASYTEELHTFLTEDATYNDVRFGKMLLDRGGLASFKRANPWLADVDVLPYTLIYRRGEKVAEFAGGGIGRLSARLQRVRLTSARRAGIRAAASGHSRRPHMDRRGDRRSLVVGAMLVAGLALFGASAATAHVVEVTTSLSMDQVQDRAQLKAALETEVNRVLATTIAFKPTVVALTAARQVGERLMVRLLIADQEGEQLMHDLERGGNGDTGGPDDDAPPREIRL